MKSLRWSYVQSAVLLVVFLVSSIDRIACTSGTRESGHTDNQLEPQPKHDTALRAHHHNLKERRHCVSFDDNVKEVRDNLSDGEHLPEAEPLHGGTDEMYVEDEPAITEMVCGKDSQFCYALWKFDASGTRQFMKQGCWEASSTTSCKSSQCIAKSARQTTTTTTTVAPGVHSGVEGGGDTTITPGSGSSSAEGKNLEQQQQHMMQQQQHYFCCCDSDNCNMDVDIVYVESSGSEEDSGEDLGLGDAEGQGEGRRSLQIILILCGSILCGLLIIFVGHRYWKRMALQYNKNGAGAGADGDGGEDGLSTLGGACEGKLLLLGGDEEGVGDDRNIVDGIQLVVLLARGKFASIYEGKISSLSDEPYALKCFTKDQKEFFENERFVFNYLGKHCNHENIIKYYGWQEFEVGPTTHLILVLDKICPGNLREYLQHVTALGQQETDANNENETMSYLKIADVLRICSGIASGLSYLHGENRDGIVIAHRDLTSKNILLDGETLIPKITDFGLSLVTRGSKYYWAGRERQAEFCSLAEAGTLRYMAPELLEGAVNLKDCENALKQADVYALALITWEVANCSKDVRLTKPPQQQQPPSSGTEGVTTTSPAPTTQGENNANLYCVQHGLPYEDEIGKDNLSMDLLSRHVVQYRNRPNFRRWRDSPHTRALRDTLIESWDAEPDARLTALCIVERLLDIRNIRVKNSDLPGTGTGQQQCQAQTPLESPGQLLGSDSGIIDSPWTGRNPCLQRNLLTVTATSTTSGGGSGMGMGGMSTSGSGMSESNSLLLESHPHHPLLLNHFDFTKNQANLNFYHNYVGGSSGGASYSSTSTTSAGMGGGGGGGNTTEMSNVSSLADDHLNPIIETRFHQNAQQAVSGPPPSAPAGSTAATPQAGPPPLPPTIPFVQNLHA